MVKWICMNEILFAEIYYICIAIMLILGFKTYRSMMKNSQKVNVIKLRDDKPSGYYCLDGIFI